MFFITVSSEIKCVIVEHTKDQRTLSTAMDCLKAVIGSCNIRNFRRITVICGHGDFEPMKDVLKTKCDIELNPMSDNEHAAETEHMTHAVKERVHAVFS